VGRSERFSFEAFGKNKTLVVPEYYQGKWLSVVHDPHDRLNAAGFGGV
jgi:hypothetical protein